MKTVVRSLILAAAAFATPVLAHPPGEDGGHGSSRYSAPQAEAPPPAPVTAEAAQEKARTVLGTLIDRKIVGPTWRAVPPTKAAVRDKAGAKEWVVTFRNDREPVRAKRTLYVFLTDTGDYKAANHTGA